MAPCRPTTPDWWHTRIATGQRRDQGRPGMGRGHSNHRMLQRSNDLFDAGCPDLSAPDSGRSTLRCESAQSIRSARRVVRRMQRGPACTNLCTTWWFTAVGAVARRSHRRSPGQAVQPCGEGAHRKASACTGEIPEPAVGSAFILSRWPIRDDVLWRPGGDRTGSPRWHRFAYEQTQPQYHTVWALLTLPWVSCYRVGARRCGLRFLACQDQKHKTSNDVRS